MYEQEPVSCPLKDGLVCGAKPKEILTGRCNGICPRSDRVYNNPRDGFGRSVDSAVELFRPKDNREVFS